MHTHITTPMQNTVEQENSPYKVLQMSIRLLTLLLLASVLSLSGCAAIVAGAAGGAAAAHDLRSTTTMLEDEGIELSATDMLYNDSKLDKKIHVNVTSYNYILLLTGEVLSPDLRTYAVELVRDLKNVRRIHNELVVADLTVFESRTYDTWITSKVKTAMLTTPKFDATRIKVVTENKSVFLMGIVSVQTGNKAANIARHVEGVGKVIKLFEYIEPEEEF